MSGLGIFNKETKITKKENNIWQKLSLNNLKLNTPQV